ncbi:hypothetical protein BDZ91DRAFT_497445 [Kalaharituber pfeilii]|nr:hypothetical protein BDZ91DRAFT_497445 [Kalaharituber pfeilii]
MKHRSSLVTRTLASTGAQLLVPSSLQDDEVPPPPLTLRPQLFPPPTVCLLTQPWPVLFLPSLRLGAFGQDSWPLRAVGGPEVCIP